MGIRRLPPEELVSFYRRIFNGVFAPAPGVFLSESVGARAADRAADHRGRPDLCFEGSEVFLGDQVARCLTPKAPPAASPPSAPTGCLGACAGAPRTAIRSAAFPLLPLVLFDHSQFEIHKRAQILSAQKAAGSFAVEVGKQIEEIGWILDEASNSRFVSVIPTMWVFGRDSAQARDGRPAKRLWESAPSFMVQEESYLLPVLLAASLPFGLYPEKRTLKLLERDFRMPVKAAALMAPVQTDFRGGGRPALLYVGRKGQLVTLDLFDPRINNYNFVVSAESGAGKSFLLNNLCQQYYAQGALIRIIDIGGSYRKLCTLCSGRYIDIGEERLVLNPFDMGLALDGEDKQSAIAMAVAIVAEMANASTRKPVTTSEWNLLKSAVQTVDSGRGEDGIDAVREWLGAIPTTQFRSRPGRSSRAGRARTGVQPARFRVGWRVRPFLQRALDLRHIPRRVRGARTRAPEGPARPLQRDRDGGRERRHPGTLPLGPRQPRFVLCDEAAQFMTRSDGQDLSRLAEAFGQGIAARANIRAASASCCRA
jgi:conjugal transfer ATP-binding protein TraC